MNFRKLIDSKYKNILNAILLQITWFGCVAGQVSWGLQTLGVMILFSVAVGTFWVDIRYAIVAALIGTGIDSAWVFIGILDYSSGIVAPFWITMLWIAVGLSLNHALSFFKDRPLLGGFLGAGSAPGCYLVGQSFGGVDVADPWLLGVISVVWFFLFYAGFSILRMKRKTQLSVGNL